MYEKLTPQSAIQPYASTRPSSAARCPLTYHNALSRNCANYAHRPIVLHWFAEWNRKKLTRVVEEREMLCGDGGIR